MIQSCRDTTSLERIPSLTAVPLDLVVYSFSYGLLKRIIDIATALVALIFLSPVFVFIGIAIKIGSKGPIFYSWPVVGCAGRCFVGYKFRTMVVNADELKKDLWQHNERNGPTFKMKNDPRVTSVGRILRKFSLDELPQLWSVLKGDMSLVGPRPAGVDEWPRYEPWQRRKLSVIPGMTCLWQVNGRNKINDFDEWVKLDLYYIDNWSLWLDLKILFKTIGAVLAGTGE